jgi:hypothetical protein
MPTPTDSGATSSWPAIVTMFGTLLGLILGFGLNELSYFVRTRRDDKRTISKALAELLEVWHLLRSFPLAVEALKRTLPSAIAAHDEVMLRRVLRTFIPRHEGMQERYVEAVSAVSSFLPVLAFDLRSRDMVGPFLDWLYDAIPIEPNDATFFLKLEDEIVRQTIPKLEELIEELANLHGRKTAHEVRTLLAKPLESPQEFENFLRESFAALAASAQAQAATHATQAPPADPSGNSQS